VGVRSQPEVGVEELRVRRIDPAQLGRPAQQRPASAADPRPGAATQPAAVAQSAAAPAAREPPAASARTPAPVARTSPRARAADSPGPARARVSADRVLFVLVCALLYFGWSFPTERYISPNHGCGYALGIIGGSLMLLLLVYSLRKRWSWLRFLGSTPSWFRFHMVLGVLGPLCILYHSNFSTGAANSNVALFCMLTVAGSGLVGRYIYAHVHHGLYGRKLELDELRAGAANLHAHSGPISFLPELATRLEAAEGRVLRAGSRLNVLRPVAVALASTRARWQLRAYVRRALRSEARASPVIAAQRPRLRESARLYIERRLAATRRVAAFESYERLFSLWHTLHVPLIFMMIVAAVVHVIAVHVY